jgi:peptidyl-prolyl cis-trans isomerase B (cyclophilin B)
MNLAWISALSVLAAVAAGNSLKVALETDKGRIVLELYPDKAPKTVQNFLDYVDAGHYNHTIFHRVIPNFMIQGGGLGASMQEKPTRPPIKNEADNGLKNRRGTIAMARTQVPDSATAQFFINTVDNPFLDFKNKTIQGWGYAVFGEVVEGMDVVDAIAKVKTGSRGGHQDVPLDTVMIIKAERLK